MFRVIWRRHCDTAERDSNNTWDKTSPIHCDWQLQGDASARWAVRATKTRLAGQGFQLEETEHFLLARPAETDRHTERLGSLALLPKGAYLGTCKHYWVVSVQRRV
jgi:hypothetical protein